MISWEDRIERIKVACSIKNNKQLEERLGLANGYINDLLKGKNKNPGKLAAALMKELQINPMWFEDETLDIFGKIDFEKFAPPKPRLLSELDEYIRTVVLEDIVRLSDRVKTIENVLCITPPKPKIKATLEESLAALQHRGDNDSYTSEPTPQYGENDDDSEEDEEEEYEEIPYVHDIAAGPPIPQSNDLGDIVAVPRHLMKKGKHYYAASIRGSSMTEAGIHDGDMVLIRCEDVPRDSAIQVVQYDGRSTLKLLKKSENNGWELHYRDGTGRVITCASSDYKTQGEFEAVLPKVIVLGK